MGQFSSEGVLPNGDNDMYIQNLLLNCNGPDSQSQNYEGEKWKTVVNVKQKINNVLADQI
jgi:hypothetical protein